MSGYNVEKSYAYLRGFLNGAKMVESKRALEFAYKHHTGQMRKDGSLYIAHPLEMACYAVALGITDDTMIATMLLHDIAEDCNIPITSLPVDREVRNAVRYMTITPREAESKYETKKRYFGDLLDCKEALVCKAVDRYMNLTSMAGVLKDKDVIKNVKETHQLLLPVMQQAKEEWPDLSDVLHVLRTNLRKTVELLAFAYQIPQAELDAEYGAEVPPPTAESAESTDSPQSTGG